MERWDDAAAPTAEALRERLRVLRCAAAEWADPPGGAHEPHAHERDEVIALVRGGITITIGDVDYPLVPGDILYLPAGTVHATQAHPGQGASYLVGSRTTQKGGA